VIEEEVRSAQVRHVRPVCQPNRGFLEQLDAYDVVLDEHRRRQEELRRTRQAMRAKLAKENGDNQ